MTRSLRWSPSIALPRWNTGVAPAGHCKGGDRGDFSRAVVVSVRCSSRPGSAAVDGDVEALAPGLVPWEVGLGQPELEASVPWPLTSRSGSQDGGAKPPGSGR